jgi:excisionase family DNA binding protein
MTEMNDSHIPPPYSLSIAGAAEHFGIAKDTFYKLISTGKLRRGSEYLKLGKKVIILRDQFIKWMIEKDGVIPYGSS